VDTLNQICDVQFGENVKLYHFVNLYGCEIGDETSIGTFVEIQKQARVGKRCKISSHTFICEGVTIEDEVFIGHGVTFINDRYPQATTNGQLQTAADWDVIPTRVKRGATIGSGATILCGITIGTGALVGAGAVVTKDVPDHTIVYGNPARPQGVTPSSIGVTGTATSVPFTDLSALTQQTEAAFRVKLDRIISSSQFIQGQCVREFETEFAALADLPIVVGCNSGTSALHLALRVLGIQPGDEVIVPGMSFIATAWPVVYQGATPVFCDIDPVTYTLDPVAVERRITPRTKAIIAVHLYGLPADLTPLQAIADAYNIPLIEDAAQAHLATYKGAAIGSIGRMSAFSFYPGKNLGAAGEAGALVCQNEADAAQARMLRDHGQRQRYLHEDVGYNYRMDEIQAAFLSSKLPYLAQWTLQRQKAAHRYQSLLADLPLICAHVPVDRSHVFHLYVIQTEQRESLLAFLKQQQITCGLHYPIPLHHQPCFAPYRSTDHPALPHTETLARTCLSLPLFPGITAEQQQQVANAIRAFWHQTS
jgi:dTDP-4-amino-4,6-dideoxygalactose transaminase/acetyltransferase-like isoleucine patch superfamily enzyme